MMRFDSNRSGRLDKRTFAKALNQMPVNVADDAIEHLFQAGESLEAPGSLDIKLFIEKIVAASKYSPLNIPQSTKSGKKDGKPSAGAQ